MGKTRSKTQDDVEKIPCRDESTSVGKSPLREGEVVTDYTTQDREGPTRGGGQEQVKWWSGYFFFT